MTLLVWFVVGHAFAEDPVFAGTEKQPEETPEEPAPPETTLAADVGGLWVSGNTDSFTLAAGLDGSHKWERNQLRLGVNGAYARAIPDQNGDGRLDEAERAAGRVDTVRYVGGELRYDRFLGERDSLYALSGLLLDPFQGYDTRSHAQLGYSRAVIKNETTTLFAELGADVAYENYVDGVEPNDAWIFAARGLVGANVTLNEAVSITEKLEAYENVVDPSDVRVLNDLALQAKVSNALAVQLGHRLVFDNLPVEGFLRTDQALTVTLVATLL